MINEEKTALSTENEKLLSRLDAWETGGDLGTSTLRYKDLKKQIDGLQDELYKLETCKSWCMVNHKFQIYWFSDSIECILVGNKKQEDKIQISVKKEDAIIFFFPY